MTMAVASSHMLRGPGSAAALDFRKDGELRGFDAHGRQRRIVELRDAPRRLAKAAAGAGSVGGRQCFTSGHTAG